MEIICPNFCIFSLPRYLTALLSLRAVAKQSRVGIASSSRMLSRLLAMTFLRLVGAEIKLLPRYTSGYPFYGWSNKISAISGHPFMGRGSVLPKITEVAQKYKALVNVVYWFRGRERGH